MRDFDTSGRSSDTVAVFTPCPIHCQGYRRPIFPDRLATDTAPGLATDAQARRNISHYQFIVNTAGCLLSQLSEQIWGPPVCAGTTGGGGAPKRRRAHPGGGGNPRRGGAGGDGSPSPRGRRWASTSSFPRRREGSDGFPPARERRWAPTIVIAATAGIHGGGPAGDGSPSPRGRRWASTSSFPRQREGGDGFPSPRERRWAPTFVIPAAAGGRGMGSRLRGNDGGWAV